MRTTCLTTLAAALMLAQAACTGDKAAESRGGREAYANTPAAAPNLVTVTATDFAFAAPATIPAGLTTVRVLSRGKEFHHVQLVRLDPGHTVDELMKHAAERQHQPMPEWVHFVGGPNAPIPGTGQAEATMALQAGTYALLCVIPTDGVPHMMKGMVKPLTVTPAISEARMPPADVQMTLRDYSFDIAPELTAGRHTIRVQNAAAQPHEVIVFKLAPGKTAQELMAWLQTEQGAPPGMPIGGTTLLGTGESNQITDDFEAGEYALICFVPDAKDGKPHVAHGMIRQLTVR